MFFPNSLKQDILETMVQSLLMSIPICVLTDDVTGDTSSKRKKEEDEINANNYKRSILFRY